MWFRLALKMGRTVAELQRSMSSAEFGEWVAFYSIEPFGDRIDDLRSGVIASTVANVNRGKDAPIVRPLDLIPWAQVPEPEKAAPAPEVVAAVFGVNLTEAKASGKKTFVIKRRQPGD
jgi:hypothetical protein